MFLKLNATYDGLTETYPILVNSDNIETIDPIEEGDSEERTKEYKRGSRASIKMINSTIFVTQTIFEIANMLDNRKG